MPKSTELHFEVGLLFYSICYSCCLCIAVLAEGGHHSGYIYFSEVHVPPMMLAFQTEHGPYFQSVSMEERTKKYM